MSEDADKPAEDEQPEISVDGVTETEFNLWRHNPATRMYLKFLDDFRDDVIVSATEEWLSGKTDLANEHEKRGFARALKESSEIRLAGIELFYRQKAELDAAEAEPPAGEPE